MDRKWYGCQELAKILKVSRHTITDWGRKGKLERKKIYTNKYAYRTIPSEKEKEETSTDFFSKESASYTFDEARGLYIFHSMPGQTGSASVSKEKIEALIWDYSNHTGGLSLNAVCRKYGLSRPSLIYILKCLGKTHDSTPYTDETIATEDEESLAESLLRAKEQRVLVKAERAHYKHMTRQAEKYEIIEKILLPRLEQILGQRPAAKTIKMEMYLEQGAHAVIIGLTDLHVGKRGVCGWDLETTQKVAVETCLEAMRQAVAKWGAPKMWILPCGSDMIHVDNYLGTTTKGTPQDQDGEPIEMLLVAFTLLEQIIEGLKEVAPVRVVAIPGNHDRLLGLSVGLMLSARYGSDDRIDIDIAKHGSAYVRHGNSMIGFNHGDMISPKDLPALMSSDRAQDWGECKGAWDWFTGHWHGHKMRSDEYNGCRVWTMPSLSGTDRWHKLKGYSHNRRQIALYRVDEEGGVGGVEFVGIKGLK